MARIEVTLTSNKDEILEALGEQLGQAMIAIGMAAESNAKQEITKAVYDTPESKSGYVRTGRLRNSISYGVDIDEPAVYIGSNVEYAPYVELGTSKMRARPYLKPAVENYAGEYKDLLEQAMKS
ncbi:MAG: HK97 gp10 family phage protein [Bacteroidales bacterium]|nr:HK97 gp10 family phage protein [Bacteroidales bacterium]